MKKDKPATTGLDLSLQQTITGIVKAGQNKGKLTGLHTANLDVGLAGDLKKGLYTCNVIVATGLDLSSQKQGLIYYGHNSVSKKDCLEVHILNFNDDIYGKKITVKIKKHLRGEIKFDSIEELKKQLKDDLKNI